MVAIIGRKFREKQSIPKYVGFIFCYSCVMLLTCSEMISKKSSITISKESASWLFSRSNPSRQWRATQWIASELDRALSEQCLNCNLYRRTLGPMEQFHRWISDDRITMFLADTLWSLSILDGLRSLFVGDFWASSVFWLSPSLWVLSTLLLSGGVSVEIRSPWDKDLPNRFESINSFIAVRKQI
jgi:hypothetical protein